MYYESRCADSLYVGDRVLYAGEFREIERIAQFRDDLGLAIRFAGEDCRINVNDTRTFPVEVH